jgi:predicted Fe-Mo cluster-binding NifX family protein
MRIAIPSKDNKGLESEVCEHFGRAKYFTFVDIENGKIKSIEVVEVPFEEHNPGDLPNFIREHNGELVLAYGMGRRAMVYFESLGTQVITGAYGKIKDVVEDFINQSLKIDRDWRKKGDFGKHEH